MKSETGTWQRIPFSMYKFAFSNQVEYLYVLFLYFHIICNRIDSTRLVYKLWTTFYLSYSLV